MIISVRAEKSDHISTIAYQADYGLGRGRHWYSFLQTAHATFINVIHDPKIVGQPRDRISRP